MKFWKVYNKIWDGVVIALVLAVFIAVSLQVTMRYVFNAPLAWTEEISRYAFIWLAWLGSAVGMRQRKLICIDLIDRVKNPVFQKCVDIFQKAVSTVVLIIFTYFGITLVIQNIGYTAIVSRVNMGLIDMCIPVGSVGMLVYLLIAPREDVE